MSFQNTRRNGLSNSDVLIEVVSECSPDDVITYDALAERLSEGCPVQFDRTAVQRVVSSSEHKMAAKTQRALMCVTNTGYRVAKATEHQLLASRKGQKANKLLKRGLFLLKNVRWDEMSSNERTVHEAQLAIMSAQQMRLEDLDSRLKSVENAIAERNS